MAPTPVQVEQDRGYNGAPAVKQYSSPVAVLNYVLRLVALVLAVLAAIVVGTAKQTGTFPVDDDGNQLGRATLKAISLSAVRYFVAANVVAAAYSFASLVLSIATRGASKNLTLLLILDVMVVALLFSAIGAESATAVIAKKGAKLKVSSAGDRSLPKDLNVELWSAICDDAGKVCKALSASIVLSTFAALAYVVLIVFAILALRGGARQ